jgi:hypothetical protein
MTASPWILLQNSRCVDVGTVIPFDNDGESRERSMMGQREVGQGQFFYAFDLDRVVPPDHLVRQIDPVLDLNLGTQGACTLLLAHGPAFDRPGVDDSDANHWICVCDPLRAGNLC